MNCARKTREDLIKKSSTFEKAVVQKYEGWTAPGNCSWLNIKMTFMDRLLNWVTRSLAKDMWAQDYE